MCVYYVEAPHAYDTWHFRYNKITKVSEKRSSYAYYKTISRACVLQLANVAPVTLELYVSDVPNGAACARWALPRVLDEVVGPLRDGTWHGRHAIQMRRLIDLFGVSGVEHLMFSRRVVQGRVDGAEHAALQRELVALADAEYSRSTVGLVALLASFPVGRMKPRGGAGSIKNASMVLLDALLSKVVPA